MKTLFFFFLNMSVLLGCKPQNRDSSIIPNLEEYYDARCDTLIELSKDDADGSYFAFNMVDDSSNLNWWGFCLNQEDRLIYFYFYDFVKSVIEKNKDFQHSIEIIQNAMIQKDYHWQCHSVCYDSYIAYYSRHELALTTRSKKNKPFLEKKIEFERMEQFLECDFNCSIEEWQNKKYGKSLPFVLFRVGRRMSDNACYIIRMEDMDAYSYAVLFDCGIKHIFSLEDACGLYENEDRKFSPTETFSKMLDVILTSYLPSTQKYMYIKAIVEEMECLKNTRIMER